MDDLWSDKDEKIETKYELAVVILDHWIKQHDFNVVEEFYNVELAYRNLDLQFVVKLESRDLNREKEDILRNFKQDVIRVFGYKLNFIINKIAHLVKSPLGNLIQLPKDFNLVNNRKQVAHIENLH